MRTAVDTSFLLAIMSKEETSDACYARLMIAARQGELVICDVVAAELAAALGHPNDLPRLMADMGLVLDPMTLVSAQEAGGIWKRYRAAGGTRARMIPDFLIAAHALHQADRLATLDRGYARAYFPKLKLLGGE